MAKDYQDGPVSDEKRSCTDCVCLIIFILFSIAMLVIGIYAWTNGNFKKLTYPYDPDGKGCGLDYPNYPYIYFASPHADSLWVTVCLSKCPVQGDTTLQCQTNSIVKSCAPVNNADNTKSVQIYDTESTGGLICRPTSDTIQNNIAEALGGSSANQLSTLAKNYTLILYALPIAIILSIIFLLIVRIFGGCFVYLLVFLTIAALVGFGAYVLTADATGAAGSISILQDKTAKTILAVVCFVLAGLILLMFICFRKRIALAASIVKVSAKFVAQNCLLILLPAFLFVIMILFVALWVLEALGYYSLGTPSTNLNQYPFQHFDTPTSIKVLGAVHVFYLFWVVMFLVETGHFIIGGTACSWYYKTSEPYSQTSRRYRKYHIGSVCLGSFFVALVGFIKFLYELLTPEKTDEQGCMASYKKFCDCLCCLCVSYLFNCFNSGAYTTINLTGDNYCKSALQAFKLKLENIATSAVVAIIQVIITVLIRIGITALTVLIIYIINANVESFSINSQDPSLLLIIVGVLSFAIASLFIAVYSEAMEAIYTTYILDADAGGNNDKNQRCPEQLKDFLKEAEDPHYVKE